MGFPNFKEERKLWSRGYKFVAGLDEAGRGALCGPVVAAAVCIENLKIQTPKSNQTINPKSKKRLGHWALEFGISGVKDSKQLSAKKREQLYDVITKHPNIKWGIGIVSEKVIDKINILEATKLAMQKATRNLVNKGCWRNSRYRGNYDNSWFLLIDGNFKLDFNEAASRPEGYPGFCRPKQKSIIKGDQKVVSISAASIIAKVTRDRLMLKYDEKYPEYGFKKHKGYPTELHVKMLKKFGACKIHRKSFRLS